MRTAIRLFIWHHMQPQSSHTLPSPTPSHLPAHTMQASTPVSVSTHQGPWLNVQIIQTRFGLVALQQVYGDGKCGVSDLLGQFDKTKGAIFSDKRGEFVSKLRDAMNSDTEVVIYD